MPFESLLDNFEEHYHNHRDLFKIEFGVSLNKFLGLMRYLLESFIGNLNAVKADFPYLPNGNVDVNDPKFFFLYTSATFFPIDEIERKFGGEISEVIERLTYNSAEFDEHQLRYHQLTRTPFIRQFQKSEKYLQICPELILDSLFINLHYSLLENKEVRDEYKARSSDEFVSKIIAICRKFGYYEISRELELKEGKQDIGDVDLVMRDDQNKFLLIEAKNHALPLDVYFKDFKATNNHLSYLQRAWERPVISRLKHLEQKASDYGISGPFEYIIVSRFPEILSHYSQLLVLSIYELEVWLSNRPTFEQFSDLYRYIWEQQEGLSIQDLGELHRSGLIMFGPQGIESLQIPPGIFS